MDAKSQQMMQYQSFLLNIGNIHWQEVIFGANREDSASFFEHVFGWSQVRSWHRWAEMRLESILVNQIVFGVSMWCYSDPLHSTRWSLSCSLKARWGWWRLLTKFGCTISAHDYDGSRVWYAHRLKFFQEYSRGRQDPCIRWFRVLGRSQGRRVSPYVENVSRRKRFTATILWLVSSHIMLDLFSVCSFPWSLI